MNYLKHITTILFIASFFAACGNDAKQTEQDVASSTTKLTGTYAVEVTMENQTHTLDQKDINPVGVTFKNDTLQFVFYTNDAPFKLNLNLNNTDIINKGSATYTIPEANAEHTTVDLNFYNAKREGKSANRRIVFRKGTIHIKKLTKNSCLLINNNTVHTNNNETTINANTKAINF